MDVLLVDAGLALVGLGLLSLLLPLRLLRIRTRSRAAAVLAGGLVLLAFGLALPVTPPSLPGPRMALDEIVPHYQFGEHHEIRIAAPPARVYAAVRAVTAREIRFFRSLTWLRSPHWPGRAPESIVNPAADRPILDVALGTSFVLLREDKEQEIVVGTIVCCDKAPPPRSAEEFLGRSGSVVRAAMNFYLVDEGGGSTRLITQTRVSASDPGAERPFAAYWRVIYPGSAFIRRMWLQAIQRRAESPTP